MDRAPVGGREMSGAERLTASEAAARLEAGSLNAETLVRDCLDRAQARAAVKAWVWLDPEQALAQARAAEGRLGADAAALLQQTRALLFGAATPLPEAVALLRRCESL